MDGTQAQGKRLIEPLRTNDRLNQVSLNSRDRTQEAGPTAEADQPPAATLCSPEYLRQRLDADKNLMAVAIPVSAGLPQHVIDLTNLLSKKVNAIPRRRASTNTWQSPIS